MKKNFKLKSGFTMVELIFVIVIIGLLAAVSLPKLVGTTEAAKTNAELSTMENLKSGLEWSKQKYVDIATPEWNGGADTETFTFDVDQDGFEEFYLGGKLANLHLADPALVSVLITTGTGTEAITMTAAARGADYALANVSGSLFTQVSDAGGKGMKVVGYQNLIGVNGDDVLILTGKSSDSASGIDFPSIVDSGATQDLTGKPDRNDFWVFNGKASAITIDTDTADADTTTNSNLLTTVPPYGIVLIDIDGVAITDYTAIKLSLDGDTISGEAAANEVVINTNL